jgi:hypothetical protein
MAFFVVVAGCGGSAVREPLYVPPQKVAEPSPPADSSAPRPAPPAADPWALPDGPRDTSTAPAEPKDVRLDAWKKAVKAKGVPPAPASCAAFAKPAAVKAPTDLSAVLLEKDATKRNAMLAALESNAAVAASLRAMRADLAPVECADAITDPLLSASPGTVSEASGQLLVGLSLASKLSRTAPTPPAIKSAADKEAVKRFISGPLRQWMVEQASAIDALSVPASELVGLARGVVAIESGMADLRLVDRIRKAPTPSSWDKEMKAVYEAALDEGLEPRKTRGRDAALVGLADFAAAGIVHDARVDRARALLSQLYGGRRIDALEALMLPPKDLEPPSIQGTALQLVPTDPAKRDWFTKMNLPAPAPVKSARTRIEMGRSYWRRVDFVEAAHAASKEATTPSSRLVLALSIALARGPNGAKEMMTAPAPSALGLGNTDALDALAKETSPVAGMAAFDAAHLRSLSPPEGEAAGPYLADVAARFRNAARLLEDKTQKKRAEERAVDAETASKAATGAKPASASPNGSTSP